MFGRGSDGGMTTMMTTKTMMSTTMTTRKATEMETDRSSRGGTVRVGAGLLFGIDKNDDDSNINTRKRETNRSKTAAKSKNKIGVGGKVKGLDTDLGWATNFLEGGQFDIYVDSEEREC